MARAGPIVAILAATAVAAAASAQETYTLTEQDRWAKTKAIEPGTPEFQLHQARLALLEGRHDRAIDLATQWIERHSEHESIADAYLVRGDALRAGNDLYEALFDYEYVARVYPGSEAFVTALERELEIARLFATGTKRKLWGLPLLDASDEAEELFIRIQERMPGSRIAEEAGLALGEFYFQRSTYDMAATVYELFIENYPSSEHVGMARRRLIIATLAQYRNAELDASSLLQARADMRALQSIDPASAQKIGAEALLARVDESLAAKLLVTARWYERVGDPISAEASIRRLVLRYPRTLAAAEALRLVQGILPRLPASILREAPDYAGILRGEVEIAAPSDIVEPELIIPSRVRRETGEEDEARPEPPDRPVLSPEAVEEKP
jgi:outer membrane assembly lipoprotein YfiO